MTKKKINTDVWDNYSYWGKYENRIRNAMMEQVAQTDGMEYLGKKFSNRTLKLLPWGFAQGSEVTPFGTIYVGVDDVIKVKGKNGGIVVKMTVIIREEKQSSRVTEYSFEYGTDSVIEAIDDISQSVSHRMRRAWDDLRKNYIASEKD